MSINDIRCLLSSDSKFRSLYGVLDTRFYKKASPIVLFPGSAKK